MSPRTQLSTNDNSIQGSPEGLKCREAEVPPPLELPESVLVSRKSSHPTAMSEAVAISKKSGLIRRLSNKASGFAGRRRQSSTATNSRDHSTGPVTMRRRSDSTNTAPELRPALLTESDEEHEEESKEDGNTEAPGEPNGSANGSISTQSNDFTGGPVIPAILLQGTPLNKVSKKKKKDNIRLFTLDIDAAKVSWDKKKPSKAFYIDDIKEIRSGAEARNYRAECGIAPEYENRFFSVLYNVPNQSKEKSQKLMHLIAEDVRTCELWTTTLDAISKHRHELMASLSSFNDKAVRAYWRREMKKIFGDKPHSDDEELIDLGGVERLCRSLHIHGVHRHLCATFAQADISNTGRLSFAEFQGFITSMKWRADVRALFDRLSSAPCKGMSLQEFMKFLREDQGEDVAGDPTYWEGVFKKFIKKANNKSPQDGEEPLMSETVFTNYLTSTVNVPVKRVPASFTLDRPMNEYFISSSHNTYLLGRQVNGSSSVEAYISALMKGCKCVEVDCWDGNDGFPIVTHGRTLTSSVTFRNVMAAISKYAFVKNPYPVWVSLEVHCNDNQQALMADIIKNTCGSQVVLTALDPDSQQLPSPEQLKNRIIIKVKKPRDDESPTPEPVVGRRRGVSVPSPYIRPTVLENALSQTSTQIYSPPISPRQRPTVSSRKPSRVRLSSNAEGQDLASTSESENMLDDVVEKKAQSNIVRVLGELGVYAAGVKFRGFDARESKAFNHIYSFMEGTFARHSSTTELKRLVVRHNMRYMMRVYPAMQRITSSNFDPLMYWRRGVQMAALNWQTYDLGMQINDAMFAAGTDTSGYVLKPSSLREIRMLQTVPEAAGAGHVKRERKQVRFNIDVISAQQLMRPKSLHANRTVDPYVEVEVYHADDKTKVHNGVSVAGGHNEVDKSGPSGIGAPRRRRTDIVSENGFNPVFKNGQFQFNLITKYPELVFVRFTVRASRDGHTYEDVKAAPLAVYTAKLNSLKQGYRTLPLMDNNGDQFLFSTLFCKIKVEPVTSVYVDNPVETGNKLRNIGRSVFQRTGQAQQAMIAMATPNSSTEMLLNPTS